MLKKNLFLILFSLFLVSVQTFPYLYLLKNTPKDRVYLGAERYYPDYYAYLFYVNQGNKGEKIVQDLFTNEPHGNTIVHYEYLIIGKIGSLFAVSPQLTYFLARSLLLLIYIYISFWFIGLFIQNYFHKISVLALSFLYDGFFFLNLNNFYQPPNLITRLTNEPHKFIGMSLFLLTLYALRQKKLFLLGIFSVLIGFIHGASAVSLMACLSLFIFLQFISSKKIYLPAVFSLILLPIPLIYWNFVFSNNPVWKYMDVWENQFVQTDLASPIIPSLLSYLFILGPLIILTLIGLQKFLKEHKSFGLLILSFIASNFILLFIGFIILKTSKIRYFQTPYLLAFAVMAYYGIITIAQKIKIKNNSFLVIFTLALIIPGIPNIFSGISSHLKAYKNSTEITVYPPKQWYKAILWLDNISKSSVVLSLPKAGLIIPATPGRRVVIGDYVSSYNYFQKLPLVKNFFSNQMSLDQAINYLKQERVNYVFYGLEEKTYGNLDKYSKILTPVFKNEDAAIYKVAY